MPGASAQGREQIGAFSGGFISALPDGRLTELLRLDCGGYIVSETTSAVPIRHRWYTQMRHQLPEIVSPFGCAAALRRPSHRPPSPGGRLALGIVAYRDGGATAVGLVGLVRIGAVGGGGATGHRWWIGDAENA
jgi:hypothetical protein